VDAHQNGILAAYPPGERRIASRASKGERGIRQRRYWEHLIRDEGDFARHVDYIHFNPVKHGHVTLAADWPYSSIHRYIEAGMMNHDWGGGICCNDKSGYGRERMMLGFVPLPNLPC
jgi:putative transposase